MKPFWKQKSLAEMSAAEWESLCDGCGRCCLLKLQDTDTGIVHYTNVACRLLDLNTCRCKDYARRKRVIPTCLVLSADEPDVFDMLPPTCAYRRLNEGKDLPDWHPLVTGRKRSVRQAGIAVCGLVVSEEYIHPDQLEEHIVDWPNAEQ